MLWGACLTLAALIGLVLLVPVPNRVAGSGVVIEIDGRDRLAVTLPADQLVFLEPGQTVWVEASAESAPVEGRLSGVWSGPVGPAALAEAYGADAAEALDVTQPVAVALAVSDALELSPRLRGSVFPLSVETGERSLVTTLRSPVATARNAE